MNIEVLVCCVVDSVRQECIDSKEDDYCSFGKELKFRSYTSHSEDRASLVSLAYLKHNMLQ